MRLLTPKIVEFQGRITQKISQRIPHRRGYEPAILKAHRPSPTQDSLWRGVWRHRYIVNVEIKHWKVRKSERAHSRVIFKTDTEHFFRWTMSLALFKHRTMSELFRLSLPISLLMPLIVLLTLLPLLPLLSRVAATADSRSVNQQAR